MDSINVEEISLVKFPQIILLCGGCYDVRSADLSISLRNYILSSEKNKLKDYIKCPEQFTEWLEDGVYHDLIEFETDFASIASAVVVCLESPGSIAEFGAFSQIKSIANKMLVVIDSEKAAEKSFITLGPIRYVKKQYGENNVSTYGIFFKDGKKSEKFKKQEEDLLEDIKNIFNENYPKSKKFNKSEMGHIFLLIFELIECFNLLKFQEIISALEKLEIKTPKSKLAQYLFLMEKMEFIRKIEYGHDAYYTPMDKEIYKNYIKFSFKENKGFKDKARFIIENIEYYKNTDARRYRALSLRSAA